MPETSPLIGVPDLAASIGDVVVIDASWVYPPFNSAGIDVRQRYRERHIPGSWFLDLASQSRATRLLDPRVPALMRPPRTLLQGLVAGAVPSRDSPIVVTDMDGGCTSAPFARWLLRDAGYANVRLLDGGTPSWWLGHGLALTDREPRLLALDAAPSAVAPSVADASPWFATFEDIRGAIEGRLAGQLLDCRAFAGNNGVLPDDYGAVEIPCAGIVRSTEVVEETDHGQRFQRPADLKALFAARFVDHDRPKITTCYFGVGAAVVATALEIACYAPTRVYAGSIIEYAHRVGAG